MLLSVNNISVGYKGLLAIQDVSFHVDKGEVVSLIGSNGAGKSTIIKTIAGLLHPREGEIVFNGSPISSTAPYDIVKKRISMVPEGRRLFGRLSVLDNLLLGAYALQSKAEVGEALETVFSLFPILRERKGQRADTFSGGEQQQLAIARGLMSRPALLMLDEPSLGLMPKLVSDIFRILGEISEKGVTVLLVEQNVFEALQISHRAYVLQTGRIVLEGKGEELLKSDLVRKAYLGM
jgi:branched-chain amino acid transport system ATP-binding protein